MPRKNRHCNAVQQPIGADNIGHKMLEKMGWSSGLGLGKNNQGDPNILKIRERRTTSGLRCTDETSTSLPHQTAFEDLLGKLSSSNDEMSVDLNTPMKTKIFRRTPRYKKMARAKDVTNYAEKDLQGILGSDAHKIAHADESKVSEGCLPKTSNMQFRKPYTLHDIIHSQCNASTSYESSEIDNKPTSSKYHCREFTNSKRKERKSADLEAENGIKFSTEDSEYPPVSNQENNMRRNEFPNSDCEFGSQENDNTSGGIDNPSCSNLGKKKRRRRKKSDCQHEEEKLKILNHEMIDCNETTDAISSKNTRSKNSISKKDTNLEHDDLFANTSRAGDCCEDNSTDYEREMLVDTKSKQSRHKKSNSKGKKCKSSDVCPVKSLPRSEENSESGSSALTKPDTHYMNYDEEVEWRRKILSSPALLEELCSNFVGSNLHKIKGYGNW